MDDDRDKLIQSESNQWYAQIFNNVHIGILIVDKNRIILKVNQTFCDLFGYSQPEETIGNSVKALHVSDESYQSFGQLDFETLLKMTL